VAARAQEPRTTRRPHIKGTTTLLPMPVDQGYDAFRDWKYKYINRLKKSGQHQGKDSEYFAEVNQRLKKDYFDAGGTSKKHEGAAGRKGFAAHGRQGAKDLDEFEEFEDVGEDPAAESPAAAAKQDESPAAAAKQDFWDAEGRTEAASHEAQEHAKAEVMDRLGEEGWLTPESG
jgi:hypothetical protein